MRNRCVAAAGGEGARRRRSQWEKKKQTRASTNVSSEVGAMVRAAIEKRKKFRHVSFAPAQLRKKV